MATIRRFFETLQAAGRVFAPCGLHARDARGSRTRPGAWLSFPLVLAVVAPLPGQPSAEEPAFFETKIRPVLVEHCHACHSTKANKQRGGLLLDSRERLLQGGDSGPVLVPGLPEKSLLLAAVRHHHPTLKMPPKGRLPDAVIADLEAWIRHGAPFPPGVAAAHGLRWEETLRQRRTWWSLQPVRAPQLPTVHDSTWSSDPIDRFIRARLEQAGLRPADDAEAHTLVRRLSLVLTGLPPSPHEIDVFLRDDPAHAYETLVDRLLASPHFGERWARHWLDVVRYADTHGSEWNYEVHHAWRYRDCLIRAFNQDVPFDQLVREHIAGDLLPSPRRDPAEGFNESIIATSFWRFGEVNHDDCIEFRSIGYDLLDNQIDTFAKAFQATTIACARCHDHKLDAVSMKDYYALLGILRSSRQVSHTLDAPEVNAEPMCRLRELKPRIRAELAAVWLREARDAGRYLLAASRVGQAAPQGLDPKHLAKWSAALKAEKVPPEDPLSPWFSLQSSAKVSEPFAARWQELKARHEKERRERSAFNAKHFTAFGDFRSGMSDGWRADGHGLRGGAGGSGDFAVACSGDEAV